MRRFGVSLVMAIVWMATISVLNCQSTDESTTTSTTSTTTTTTTTVTQRTSTQTVTFTTSSHSSDPCSQNVNATCKTCLQDPECFWCNEDSVCKTYKISGIFPEGCSASKARWISCSLNFQALLISVIVVAVVIIILVAICVCYCCNKTCKACSDRHLQRVERKLMKQREKIRQSNDARKQERKAKNDEIRIKYGLQPATYSATDD